MTQELDALKDQLTLTQDELLGTTEAASAKHAELTKEVTSLKSQLELATQRSQQVAREAEEHETALKGPAAAAAKQKAELQAQVSELQLQSRKSRAELDEKASQLEQAQAQSEQLQQALEKVEQDHQQLAQQVPTQTQLLTTAHHATSSL